MKIKFLALSLFSVVALSTASYSASLAEVYQQAVKDDPTFQNQHAAWIRDKQNYMIAVGGYLPTINASAGITEYITPSASTGKTEGYSLSATQPILSFAAWSTIASGNAAAKAATALYLSKTQDLINRAITAYFTVLKDKAQLQYTVAYKRQIYQQLKQAQQQYKVGLIAKTGVYDAQSKYDAQSSQEIANKATLENDLEALRVITGQRYNTLNGIRGSVPLVTPSPRNINEWVKIAVKQNYGLKAENYTVQAKKSTIATNAGSFIPTISASATYGSTQATPGAAHAKGANYGLAVSYNAFNPVTSYAQTKQARYDYLAESATLEQTYRNVVSSTRQAYLGVTSGISKIKADRQAIRSAEKSVEATQAGYKVGTRTMVEILTSLSALNQAKQTYINDQYNYLSSMVALKQAAGTLSIKDLYQISNWLTQPKYLNTTINRSYATQTQTIKKRIKIKKTNIKKPKSTGTHKKLTTKKNHFLASKLPIPNIKMDSIQKNLTPPTKHHHNSQKSASVKLKKKSALTQKKTTMSSEKKVATITKKIPAATKKPKHITKNKTHKITTLLSPTKRSKHVTKKTTSTKAKAIPLHYYTVELFKTRSKAEAKKILAILPHSRELYIHSNKPQFKLIYGKYKKRSEAIPAYKKLSLRYYDARIIRVNVDKRDQSSTH